MAHQAGHAGTPVCYSVETMTATTPGFDELPATKQDVADVKKELKQDIERVETKVDIITTTVDQLGATVKNGFENLEKLLNAPNMGLIPRVKRVEEEVGIRPGI